MGCRVLEHALRAASPIRAWRPPPPSGTCSCHGQEDADENGGRRALGRNGDRLDVLERLARDELDQVDRALGGDAEAREDA